MKNQGREKERGLKNENLSLSRKNSYFLVLYMLQDLMLFQVYIQRGVRETFFCSCFNCTKETLLNY